MSTVQVEIIDLTRFSPSPSPDKKRKAYEEDADHTDDDAMTPQRNKKAFMDLSSVEDTPPWTEYVKGQRFMPSMYPYKLPISPISASLADLIEEGADYSANCDFSSDDLELDAMLFSDPIVVDWYYPEGETQTE